MSAIGSGLWVQGSEANATMERAGFSYDDFMDKAYLAASLVSLSLNLAKTLEGIGNGLDSEHWATSTWLSGLSNRFSEEAKATDFEQPHRIGTKELAHRIGRLSEIARQVVRANYAVPSERVKLAYQLERVEHLAYELDGLEENKP